MTAASTHGKTPRAFADDYFDENGYGIRARREAACCCWFPWRNAIGDTAPAARAIRAFTEYGLDYMEERIPPLLTSGDYMEAFETFVSLCEDFLRETEENRPYDIDNKIREPKTLSDYLFYLVISVAAGRGYCVFRNVFYEKKAQDGGSAARRACVYPGGRRPDYQVKGFVSFQQRFKNSKAEKYGRRRQQDAYERRRQSSRRTRRKVLSARAERGEIVKYVLTMHAYVGIIAQSDFG